MPEITLLLAKLLSLSIAFVCSLFANGVAIALYRKHFPVRPRWVDVVFSVADVIGIVITVYGAYTALVQWLVKDSLPSTPSSVVFSPDENAWSTAKIVGTAAGYAEYISEQPSGRHLSEAKEAIGKLSYNFNNATADLHPALKAQEFPPQGAGAPNDQRKLPSEEPKTPEPRPEILRGGEQEKRAEDSTMQCSGLTRGSAAKVPLLIVGQPDDDAIVREAATRRIGDMLASKGYTRASRGNEKITITVSASINRLNGTYANGDVAVAISLSTSAMGSNGIPCPLLSTAGWNKTRYDIAQTQLPPTIASADQIMKPLFDQFSNLVPSLN